MDGFLHIDGCVIKRTGDEHETGFVICFLTAGTARQPDAAADAG